MFTQFSLPEPEVGMSAEHLTSTGMLPLGKEILLVEDEVARLVNGLARLAERGGGDEGILERLIPEDDNNEELRSRHAGILLDQNDEVGSWFGWGDGEGMYLEGEREDWTGWGGGRQELEESARLERGGGSEVQIWGTYGLEEEEEGYKWGGRDEGEGWYGEKEVERRSWASQAELEELDTLQRAGKGRRRRRRKRPENSEKENPPPEAGG